ncbi:MAG: molybdopterin biosynthesis-like protein MoeZ [Syntrophorhabdus sp. PtaB.Bin047]|jgi:hypothetical protein|nr:MAG: molybdopterin biosynthesis-like protein MoeZ [Syntrophorhabdus sp. PtaB.Bin047]
MARHHPPTASKHAPPLLALLALAVLNLFPAGCFFAGSIGDIDVRKLEGLMEREKQLLIVDNRSTLEYASGHIPGAMHIPQEEFYRLASFLPPEKDTPIVFYCRGYG